MAKKTDQENKVDLERIPEVLEKIVAVVDREVEVLSSKDQLTDAESKNLIQYANTLTAIYKDYRAQILVIEKDLKSRSKEEILQIVKAEVANG